MAVDVRFPQVGRNSGDQGSRSGDEGDDWLLALCAWDGACGEKGRTSEAEAEYKIVAEGRKKATVAGCDFPDAHQQQDQRHSEDCGERSGRAGGRSQKKR